MRDPLSILIRKYINKPQQRSPDPSHSVSCLSHRHFSRILPPNHSLRSISNVFVARRMHYRRNRRYPLLADADSRLPLSTFITYQLSEHPAIHLISGHLNDLKQLVLTLEASKSAISYSILQSHAIMNLRHVVCPWRHWKSMITGAALPPNYPGQYLLLQPMAQDVVVALISENTAFHLRMATARRIVENFGFTKDMKYREH